MKPNEFYSVVTKKTVSIPSQNIKQVTRNGRHFLVGTYTANGKTYQAWKTVAKK